MQLPARPELPVVPFVLATSRLRIRLPRVEDASGVALYYSRNRDHLAPVEPLRPPLFFTREFWEARAAEIADEFEREMSARFVLFRNGEPDRVIGTASLTSIQRGPLQGANLGYSLDRDFQGQGLMREALEAVIQFAFGCLHLHRIFAGYMPANERSARVLRGLGFEVIGYCRDYLCIAGRWQDHVLTSLQNKGWTAQCE